MQKKSLDPARIVVKKLILSYFVKLGLAVSGPFNWIAAFFVNKVLKNIQAGIVKAVTYLETYFATKKEVEKSLGEYDKKINKPNAKPEDVKNAGKKFLED